MRRKVLAVTGLGSVVGMALWGLGGAESLTGATTAFILVFLSTIALSAVCEVRERCRKRRGGRQGR